MTNGVKISDELMARGLDILSAAGHVVPRLGAVVGEKDAPSQLAARWRYSGLAADQVTSWQDFDEHRASGRWPRNYKLAALISIDKEVLDDYQTRHGGHQAVVYALGTAVMVGTVEKSDFLRVDPVYPERYAVGMGIGKGVLRAAIAIRGEDGRTVVPPDGMHKGLEMPVSDWPESVPLL